ncbi:MAG: restriction endonuclease subunit S [Nitrospirae bacterium]|nr:restriction endonuclease subunit S [Nitrospirota bacterium]
MNKNTLQVSDELPKDWTITTLGEALPISYGKSLTESKRDAKGKHPVYGSSGKVGQHSQALTSRAALLIGRKGSVGAVYYSPEPCWPIDTTYFAEKREDIDLRYFEYLLKGLNLKTLDKSTAVPGLSRDDYNAVQVAVAPILEQKLIVAEIEKQFSRLDEAVANLKRVKANLKRYKAAVLKAAVEGKLTEEWRKVHPYVEPASELLKRILAERREKWEEAVLTKMKAKGKKPKDDKWKTKYIEAHPPKPEDTFKIPKSWVWTNLGQLSWSVKDGPHFSPKYSQSGIPFISGGNIRPDGIDFATAKYITPALHAELTERCKPEFGDLLYTKGGTTGIARINTVKREFSVWVHVAVLKIVAPIERFYLQHSLNSLHCYRQSQRYTHGVGNQDLGLTRMIWITMPLPPLLEQKEIIKKIEERMSIITDIEKDIDANLRRGERLRQSILKKAFTGQI